ncbi:MAG: hypothetical protein J2P58_09430 [Acidimicrobiaceae bacterium]|nr:hypothetical protein [Acidimicrobiaceae bacterium]
MSTLEICVVALLVGALLPALTISSRGEPIDRVVGLELASAVITLVLILLSEVGPGQSYDLILPLVFVPLSFAGILVFTRLLGRSPDDHS